MRQVPTKQLRRCGQMYRLPWPRILICRSPSCPSRTLDVILCIGQLCHYDPNGLRNTHYLSPQSRQQVLQVNVLILKGLVHVGYRTLSISQRNLRKREPGRNVIQSLLQGVQSFVFRPLIR